MLTLVLSAALGGAFVHPQPTPPPELPAATYQQRRARVLSALDDCITVVGSQGEVSGVTEDYRQDGNFFWLTGINEPHAFLVLAPKARYWRTTLLLRARDPEAERWTGPREPLSPAPLEKYAVDRVLRGSPERVLLH